MWDLVLDKHTQLIHISYVDMNVYVQCSSLTNSQKA